MSLESRGPVPASAGEPRAGPASCGELFVVFTMLALQGFGGVLAVAQRVLVDQKGWLTRGEFVESLALAQVLPGPNVCNLALMVGDRYFGTRGAFTALAGMMTVPLLIVLIAIAVYGRMASHPLVDGALRGMGAVAAGLLVGTAMKLASTLRGNPMGLSAVLLFGSLCFVAIAWLRWPLVWVLPVLGLCACAWSWRRLSLGPSRPKAPS